MQASQRYLAVLTVLALSDGSVREDADTACAFNDVEEAISTARWLVGGGGWIWALVFRREYRPALGLFEDADVIMKVGRFAYRRRPTRSS
jgi:hypothetical protein